MRMLEPGELDGFTGDVEGIANSQIMIRSVVHLESETGSWRFPLGRKDKTKLGEVKFKNPTAISLPPTCIISCLYVPRGMMSQLVESHREIL